MGSITRFINDDRGADLIEYALLSGLIALAAITALTDVGTSIKNIYGRMTTALDAAPTGP